MTHSILGEAAFTQSLGLTRKDFSPEVRHTTGPTPRSRPRSVASRGISQVRVRQVQSWRRRRRTWMWKAMWRQLHNLGEARSGDLRAGLC